MSAWPASLPQQYFLGNAIGHAETRFVSSMDAGPALVRNRFTAFTQSTNSPIVFTGTQLATFNTFYRTTLNHGTDSFTWTNPVDDSSISIRFKSPPKWQSVKSGIPAERLWRAVLSLEILP